MLDEQVDLLGKSLCRFVNTLAIYTQLPYETLLLVTRSQGDRQLGAVSHTQVLMQ